MECNRVEGEALDHLSGWEGEFDVDDIDPDAFAYIIESNAL